MKKILLLLLLLLSFIFSTAFSCDLQKYWGENSCKIVDTYLEKWNNNLQKKYTGEKLIQQYQNVLKKIQDFELKYQSLRQKNQVLFLKITALLHYLAEKIRNYLIKIENKLKASQTQIANPQNQSKSIKFNYKLNNNYINKDAILLPLSGVAYNLFGFGLKSLYGDSFVKSLVFVNKFGADADPVVKEVYLLSITGAVLAKSSLVDGVLYFNLENPYLLHRNWPYSFSLAFVFNKNISYNTDNKAINLEFVKQANAFQTEIYSKENGNPVDYVSNTFYAHTYYVRKSKPILHNVYTRKKLVLGDNLIYSINIASTGASIKLYKLNFDVDLYKCYVDTGSVRIKINGNRYKNIKAYFDKQTGYGKLHIIFPNFYDITSGTQINIYANFTRVPTNSKLYVKLNYLSNNPSMLEGTYTGDFALLYSDNTYQGNLTANVKNFFTEAYLDFSKVYNWYLKRR